MCPNRDRRLDWTMAERWGCLVNLLTLSLHTCWCQLIPSSILRHHWSNRNRKNISKGKGEEKKGKQKTRKNLLQWLNGVQKRKQLVCWKTMLSTGWPASSFLPNCAFLQELATSFYILQSSIPLRCNFLTDLNQVLRQLVTQLFHAQQISLTHIGIEHGKKNLFSVQLTLNKQEKAIYCQTAPTCFSCAIVSLRQSRSFWQPSSSFVYVCKMSIEQTQITPLVNS